MNFLLNFYRWSFWQLPFLPVFIKASVEEFKKEVWKQVVRLGKFCMMLLIIVLKSEKKFC